MGKLDLGAGAAGAASGAALGSAFGPIGTGVGAVGGGLLGLFGRSKKRKPKRLSTLDATQQALYDKYAQGLQGQGQFADMFNFNQDQAKDVFKKNFAQPAYQQFQEGIVPSITGQFRGGNLQNSSYLGGALAKAGTDVQKNLDAQLANMLYQGQQDSVSRRINGINSILGTQTFAYQQPGKSAGDEAFSALLNSGGQTAGNLFANKFGGSGMNSAPQANQGFQRPAGSYGNTMSPAGGY